MNDLNESSAVTERLARKLGLFDGTMMMIGIVLGSGIFLTTGIIALWRFDLRGAGYDKNYHTMFSETSQERKSLERFVGLKHGG